MRRLFINLTSVTATTFSLLTFSILNPVFASQVASITATPSTVTSTPGTSVTVNINVTSSEAFNAAGAAVATSGLKVLSLNLGNCNFHMMQTPTVSDPTFAGAILGGSSKGCTVETLTVQTLQSGTPGKVTISNASVKAYSNSAELAAAPTPTPKSTVASLTANTNKGGGTSYSGSTTPSTTDNTPAIVLGLLVIAAILGGGYAYYQMKMKNQTPPASPAPVNTDNPSTPSQPQM